MQCAEGNIRMCTDTTCFGFWDLVKRIIRKGTRAEKCTFSCMEEDATSEIDTKSQENVKHNASVNLEVIGRFFLSIDGWVGWWWWVCGPNRSASLRAASQNAMCIDAVLVGVSTRIPVTQDAAPRAKKSLFSR